MGAVDIDPELLGWVGDFIREKERVTVDDVRREFFPDEMGAPYPYLDRLVAERVIKYKARSQVYEWAYRFESRPERAPVTKRVTHWRCDHPSTPHARAMCRQAQGVGTPADFREKQLRSRWGQFMDDEVHELTAEQIQKLTRKGTTPHQFERRLRAAASNYGLKCSAKSTEKGIRFVIGDSADMDSGVLDYLPREVAAQDGWGSQRAAVLASADEQRRKRGQTAHATCTHPMTKHERLKCRKARAAKATA